MALGNVLHPDPARMSVIRQLDGTDDKHLSDRAVSTLRPIRGIMPGPERHLCVIDFDKVSQGVVVRADHRPPQLLQQKPRRLVVGNARLRLKLQR